MRPVILVFYPDGSMEEQSTYKGAGNYPIGTFLYIKGLYKHWFVIELVGSNPTQYRLRELDELDLTPEMELRLLLAS